MDNYIDRLRRYMRKHRHATIRLSDWGNCCRSASFCSRGNICRSRMLLRYFGEKNEHNCGQCDACIRRAHQKPSTPSLHPDEICQALAQSPLTPAELCDKLNADKDQLNKLLHQLANDNRIITQNGMLQIRK